MNPALATLEDPASAQSAAITRLQETATALADESARTDDQRSNRWNTLIGGHHAKTLIPPVGRMRAWLQTATRIANRSVLLLQKAANGTDLTNAEISGLATAARAARAGRSLYFVLAERAGAIVPNQSPTFVRIDAMRLARLHQRLYSDIDLTRREFVAPGPFTDWRNTSLAPIRADSDGQQAMQQCQRDVLLYSQFLDVFSVAERLAAGIEVSF